MKYLFENTNVANIFYKSNQTLKCLTDMNLISIFFVFLDGDFVFGWRE